MIFNRGYHGILGAICTILLPMQAFARHIEAGQITTINTTTTPVFTNVTFQQPFNTVPVVTALLTNVGTDPADLRIKNVTTMGFETAVIEAPGSDGPHTSETVHYVAIEAGITTSFGKHISYETEPYRQLPVLMNH